MICQLDYATMLVSTKSVVLSILSSIAEKKKLSAASLNMATCIMAPKQSFLLSLRTALVQSNIVCNDRMHLSSACFLGSHTIAVTSTSTEE